jgi:glycosyltransferase involved in cell wall biosynthesis
MLRRSDVLLVESPPLFLGLSARVARALRRCPYIFNVSDLWPDGVVDLGGVGVGAAVRYARRLECWVYAGAAALAGQSPTIAAVLRKRNPGKRVELLSNGVDMARFEVASQDPLLRERIGARPGDLVLIYVGLLGVAQGVDQIIQAAAVLSGREDLHFVIVGDGPEKADLVATVREQGLDRVRMFDSVPADQVPPLLLAADMALVPLRFALTGAVPSKIYEAMAAGLPVVFVGDGDGVGIVESSGVGVVCPIGDTAALVRAIERLAADRELRMRMGRGGREAAASQYSRRAVAGRLAALVDWVARGHPLDSQGGMAA